jgi:hypothetical protein
MGRKEEGSGRRGQEEGEEEWSRGEDGRRKRENKEGAEKGRRKKGRRGGVEEGRKRRESGLVTNLQGNY